MHLWPHFGEGEIVELSSDTIRKMDGGFAPLFIVTIALSLTIRPQFAVECLRSSNQQGVGHLGAKFGEEGGWPMTAIILTGSGRDIGSCRIQKKSCRYVQPFEHNAQTWPTVRQTDRQVTTRHNTCSKCPPFAATQERRRRRQRLTGLSITR